MSKGLSKETRAKIGEGKRAYWASLSPERRRELLEKSREKRRKNEQLFCIKNGFPPKVLNQSWDSFGGGTVVDPDFDEGF